MTISGLLRCTSAALLIAASTTSLLMQSAAAQATGDQRVVTYHYDNLRTGWNSHEQDLTPASVSSAQFKMISATQLDDLVHAQPLYMTNQRIAGHGKHDVVYVATESNTLYAIDAATGTVLRKHHFGPPVPYTELPNQCTNNGPNLGITSTPVILEFSGHMYLMAYTFRNFQAQYELHEIDLASLDDAIAPVTVTASAKLPDGTTYRFDPSVTRQRPALLLSNGNIYAGFGSFCDSSADKSRGWMLGFSGDDLSPLPANELTNARARSPNMFFLTSVWMSGAGPAASLDGDVYFTTGNSDFSGTAFNPKRNIEESAAQFSDDLSTIKGLFTPSDWSGLDKADTDFGSGGLLLLPAQAHAPSNLALALGKDGNMYLLNADNLSNGGANGSANAYDVANGGACWCAESYFQGADGVGRVVSSGNNVVKVWKVITTGQRPRLQKDLETGPIQNGQDPGVFTVVSSNNRTAGTAIVWAAGRPVDFDPGTFKLYAFDASTGKTLFSGDAGTWPFPDNNATVMPIVTNGRVFIASYKTLAIFGLSNRKPAKLPKVAPPNMRANLAAREREVYGTVRAIKGTTLTVAKRDGSILSIDVSAAEADHAKAQPSVGKALVARGTYTSAGVLLASAVLHAKSSPAMWYPDR